MTPEEKPLVSIVTINYKQLETTCAFLEAAQRLSYKNIEVIVVDNASNDGISGHLQQRYPHVKLILSKENLGFSGGNNLGIKEAEGEYILLANNDTEFTEGFIETMLEAFWQDAKIGVVCPKIRFYDRKDIIQYAGFRPINKFTGRTRAIGSLEEDKGQYDQPTVTDGAHGAAMMLKREVIDKVGLMPEVYFLYYEEWDWSTQIMKAGYKIYYQAKALIYHKESISTGKGSTLKTYYQTRNRILYMRRNTNKLQLAVFLLFLLFFVVPKSVIYYTAKRQLDHLQCFFKAVAWNLKNSPHFNY